MKLCELGIITKKYIKIIFKFNKTFLKVVLGRNITVKLKASLLIMHLPTHLYNYSVLLLRCGSLTVVNTVSP